jgi:hypothetical protein
MNNIRMKLSKNSKQLMLFFTKNNYINQVKQTQRTKTIITELYHDIYESYEYLNSLKQKGNYFHISIKKIVSASQISTPQNFNSKSFPDVVRNHIDEFSMTELTYQFSLYGRNVKVHFVLEDSDVELKIDTYNSYIDAIIMWLYIVNQYASKQCAQTIVIYLYFTSLEKKLPESNIFILDEINVNTAFTYTCPKDSEIVVFRKEEWFKVFIHESFHNFGLDFSDMNNTESHECILNIFKVNSIVNLYESYTEFWAEIINALFCSFFSLKDKKNIHEFLSYSEFFINFERTHSFFQLVKTLNFMGLTYKDLYSKSIHSSVLRDNLYKEKTNVLSYYIIKTILINNYQGFLSWCKINNFSLLQFNKTITNQREFCKFIEKNYKINSMLQGIKETQHFLSTLKQKGKRQHLNYLLSNLRMSICELG